RVGSGAALQGPRLPRDQRRAAGEDRDRGIPGGEEGMKRRLFLAAAACLAAGVSAQESKVIRIEARKFQFVPETVTVQAGVPVVRELPAPETPMGFAADALGLHADLPAGQLVRLEFTPQKVGDFDFACDVFCGSGHEDMSGTIKVIANG